MDGVPINKVSAREKKILWGILLTAVLVRLPGLGESLWFDEVYYTNTLFKSPGMLFKLLFADVHPPFYPILLSGWTAIFGDSEIAVRLPSFLFGMAFLVLFWMIARQWFGNRIALLSLVLLTLSPVHIWYSDENKNNMLLLLLCTATVWFYWNAMERRRARDWVAATGCLVLSLGTHTYALAVACSIALWIVWRTWEEKRSLRPAVYSALAAGVIIVPMALFMFYCGARPSAGYLRPFTLGEVYKFLFVWLPDGNAIRAISPYGSFKKLLDQHWIYFLVDGFFAFLLVLGLIRVWKKAFSGTGKAQSPNDATQCFGTFQPGTSSGTWLARLLLLWLILPLALTWVGSLVHPRFYIERNLLALLCPYVLVVSVGVCSSPRSVRLVVTGLYLALLVLSIWNLYIAKADRWTVYKPNPDWRSAMQYFSGEIRIEGGVLLVSTCPNKEIAYYGPRTIPGYNSADPGQSKLFTMDFCSDAGPQDILEIARDSRLTSLYLIHNKSWEGCFKNAWDTVTKDARFHRSETRQFKGITAYKFDISQSHDHDKPE
jgi:4-amino-4-deoxy-L-arabinose transferase-like glycosyltransferase